MKHFQNYKATNHVAKCNTLMIILQLPEGAMELTKSKLGRLIPIHVCEDCVGVQWVVQLGLHVNAAYCVPLTITLK